MIKYKKGDILNATEDMICHQVNVEGIMGGGLAYQIANAYPNVEETYKEYCKDYNYDYENLNGKSISVKTDKYWITNCFTQKLNFDTDYEAIKKCFKELLEYCKKENLTIAVPYKYGCGIAKGNWEEVETIFRSLSGIYDIDISIYRLEGNNE